MRCSSTVTCAHHYIDDAAQDAGAALRELGGAKVVLGTVTTNAAMTDTLTGLTHRGELVVISVNPEPFEINPFGLLGGGHKIYGHASGTSKEVEETLHFAAVTGVRPMIEQVPLLDAESAMAPLAYPTTPRAEDCFSGAGLGWSQCVLQAAT
jgi:alcohol dehydrogenase